MTTKEQQLNSKLTLIKATYKNFRSIGDEVVEIDYNKYNNLLVSSDTNGVAKSTLYLHGIYFALTGASYKQGDPVDSLINSSTGKNLEATLEFASAGKYYKIKRCRKPNSLDLYQLIDGEYLEIPNLPVSSKDRQKVLYTLLNLDAKTAASTIENCILLGSKFNGFLSMSAQERRDLIETVMDLGIFSALNKETKAQRGNLLTEQQQLLADISNTELKEALAEQSVDHTKADIDTLKRSNTLQLGDLEEKVSKCTTELENASQLDTDGGDLHCVFEEESESIARAKIDLEDKLEEDLANLGEFKIDSKDLKLINLEANYYQIDYDIDVAKRDLNEKEDSLGDEIKAEVSTLKALIADKKINHNATLTTIEEQYKVDSSAIEKQIKVKEDMLQTETEKLSILKNKLTQSEEAHGEYKAAYVEAKNKQSKYQVNIDKMLENVAYLNNKKAVEDNSLNLLTHVGVCERCGQEVTEEYLIEARKGVEERLLVIQEDLDLYTDRIAKGKDAILELDLSGLEGKIENALYSVASDKKLVEDCNTLINTITLDLERLTKVQADCTRDYVQAKTDVSLQFNNEILLLKGKLEGVDHEVSKTLGKYQATLDHLLETADSRKAALLDQIEDRKVALRGEHAGKEKNLRGVYQAEVKTLDDKLQHLKDTLERDLKQLIKDKEKAVELAEVNLKDVNAAIDKTNKVFDNSLTALKAKLDKVEQEYTELSVKVKSLQDKYEENQLNLEDYDMLLTLLSDQKGKASVVEYYLPLLNSNVNKYLDKMGLYLSLTIDNVFKITMDTDERKGQSLSSLSEGELTKVNIAIMLGLRQVSQGNSSVDCNLLVLDECLEALHPLSVIDAVEMLKDMFQDLNLVVITQRGEEFSELFDNCKVYSKKGFNLNVE